MCGRLPAVSIAIFLLCTLGCHSTRSSQWWDTSKIKKVEPQIIDGAIIGGIFYNEPSDAVKNRQHLDEMHEWLRKQIRQKRHGAEAVARLPYDDIYVFDSIECRAVWDENCEYTFRFAAPTGTQMCKLFYSVNSKNITAINVTRQDYFHVGGDQRGFKTYEVYFSASGSHVPSQQFSSIMKLTGVGFRVIPDDLEGWDRIAMGCDMVQNAPDIYLWKERY